MSKEVLTLIAYRSNGADYCRGCLMGSSDSDFEIKYPLDDEEAANTWAGYLFQDLIAERHVCHWDIDLLFDGKGSEYYFSEWSEETEAEADTLHNRRAAILARANTQADELKLQHDAQIKEKQETARALEEAKKESREKAELGRLLAKYGELL